MGSAEPLSPPRAPAELDSRVGAEEARPAAAHGAGASGPGWALVAVVLLARGALAFVLSLAFWAAAPVLAGMQPTTVVTGSMAPAIQPGDVVVAAAVETPAVGAVMLFDDPDHDGRLRLHRVVGIAGDGSYTTRGDANPADDSSPVEPDAVQGVGVLRVPFVGLPVLWATEGRWGLVAATGAGVLLLTAIATRRIPGDRAVASEDADGSGRPDAAADVADGPTEPRRRRGVRAAAATTALVAAVAVAMAVAPATIAHAAPFSATTTAGARFSATTAEPAIALTCRSGWESATLTWEYDGAVPASFDILIDGQVWVAGVDASVRSIALPKSTRLNFFSTSTVTVRTNLTGTWTAVSTSSIRVYSLPFTSGLPYCR